MAKERCKWTQKEDEILKIAVGKDVERVDWLSIAEYLPGRNNKDCRKRWHQKFATNTNYGTWSEQEDERLHMAVNQHGVKWALVAQVVGTRSSEQCSKRWKDVLNPELSRSPWAEGDDNLLLSSVDTHGRNWKMIAELHFRDRSTLSLKNRHALLLRRQSRESQSKENIPQSPYTDSGIGSASRQITLTTPSDSPPSSHGDPGDVVADELGNIPNNQNDFQYPLPHSNRTDAQIGRTNEIAVASPNGLEGDGFIPFGQSSNTSIDMSAYDNDALMSEMSRLIPDPSFLPGQPQQSHQQQHLYSDMSAFNHPQAAIDFSLPLTAPSSMVPTPKAPSDDLESWEDFLCLGINCPRKGLEAFKTAVLEAATKGPGCQGDGDDEKVQIMLKIRKKN